MWHTYIRQQTGGQFTHFEGFLPSGHDLWPPKPLTVRECLDACLASDACHGYPQTP